MKLVNKVKVIFLNLFQYLIRKFIVTSSNNYKPRKYYGKRLISDMNSGNNTIKKLLLEGKPVAVARFGSIELDYIYHYLQHKYNKEHWHGHYRTLITTNAGFFPADNRSLDQFCKLYLDEIRDIDVLGVWFRPGEDYLSEKYMKKAALIPLESIEPYYHSEPWSIALNNKTVLVIHPFADTIKSQFINKDYLFTNPDVLPNFKLVTYKAVQSINVSDTRFESWFDALEFMKRDICNIHFDIAIIGAGAYGLPLAAYIKKIGKSAIHMGGATQVLFGIKGARWEKNPFFQKLFNPFWVKPDLSERPKGELPEKGCYW